VASLLKTASNQQIASTTAGTILAEHWEITVFVLAILALFALSRTVRVFHRSKEVT
jgi:sulfur relay (sulfurtransferase) DsrC/TusE family protein